jgi:hypothetical protein
MVWEDVYGGGQVLMCDRDSSSPSCYKGKAEYELVVDYNSPSGEKDVLLLCKNCVDGIRKDALRHGYKVTVRKLRAKEMSKNYSD